MNGLISYDRLVKDTRFDNKVVTALKAITSLNEENLFFVIMHVFEQLDDKFTVIEMPQSNTPTPKVLVRFPGSKAKISTPTLDNQAENENVEDGKKENLDSGVVRRASESFAKNFSTFRMKYLLEHIGGHVNLGAAILTLQLSRLSSIGVEKAAELLGIKEPQQQTLSPHQTKALMNSLSLSETQGVGLRSQLRILTGRPVLASKKATASVTDPYHTPLLRQKDYTTLIDPGCGDVVASGSDKCDQRDGTETQTDSMHQDRPNDEGEAAAQPPLSTETNRETIETDCNMTISDDVDNDGGETPSAHFHPSELELRDLDAPHSSIKWSYASLYDAVFNSISRQCAHSSDLGTRKMHEGEWEYCIQINLSADGGGGSIKVQATIEYLPQQNDEAIIAVINSAKEEHHVINGTWAQPLNKDIQRLKHFSILVVNCETRSYYAIIPVYINQLSQLRWLLENEATVATDDENKSREAVIGVTYSINRAGNSLSSLPNRKDCDTLQEDDALFNNNGKPVPNMSTWNSVKILKLRPRVCFDLCMGETIQGRPNHSNSKCLVCNKQQRDYHEEAGVGALLDLKYQDELRHLTWSQGLEHAFGFHWSKGNLLNGLEHHEWDIPWLHVLLGIAQIFYSEIDKFREVYIEPDTDRIKQCREELSSIELQLAAHLEELMQRQSELEVAEEVYSTVEKADKSVKRLSSKLDKLTQQAAWNRCKADLRQSQDTLSQLIQQHGTLKDLFTSMTNCRKSVEEWEKIGKTVSKEKSERKTALRQAIDSNRHRPVQKELEGMYSHDYNIAIQAYSTHSLVGHQAHKFMSNSVAILDKVEAIFSMSPNRRQCTVMDEEQEGMGKRITKYIKVMQLLMQLADAVFDYVFDTEKYYSDEEIDLIERFVDALCRLWRRFFDGKHLTHKFHLVESHLIPILRERRSVADTGEQGIERLHHTCNVLERLFNNDVDFHSRQEKIQKRLDEMKIPEVDAERKSVSSSQKRKFSSTTLNNKAAKKQARLDEREDRKLAVLTEVEGILNDYSRWIDEI